MIRKWRWPWQKKKKELTLGDVLPPEFFDNLDMAIRDLKEAVENIQSNKR